MGKISGFVLQVEKERTAYQAGDTIGYEAVEEVIKEAQDH